MGVYSGVETLKMNSSTSKSSVRKPIKKPSKPSSATIKKDTPKAGDSPLRVRMPLKIGILLLVVLTLMSRWVDNSLKDILLLAAMVVALWTAFSLPYIHRPPPQHRDTVFFPTAPSLKPDQGSDEPPDPKDSDKSPLP